MIELDSLVEVKLKEDEDFLKIRETLTRIGVASRKDKTLFQSCHILHKQSITSHILKSFSLWTEKANFTEDDISRRNSIANLLAEWGLVELMEILRKRKSQYHLFHRLKFYHKEKDEWNLAAKYNIGKKR